MLRTTVAALLAGLTLTVLAAPAGADELCVGCPAPTTTTTTAPPPQESGDPAQILVGYLNRERQANGLTPFALRQDVVDIASGWSRHMADSQSLSHNAGYFSEETRTRLRAWALGENVAASPSLREGHDALMASAPHRKNILDPRFTVVGIGAVHRDGRWWITEDFLQPAPAPAAAPAAPPPAPPPAPARPAVDAASPRATSAPAAPIPAPGPAVERARSQAPQEQTLRLEPSEAVGEAGRRPGTGRPATEAPVALLGLAAAGIWAVGSAALTAMIRRRARLGSRPRPELRLGGMSGPLVGAG
jgi:uncharacterized protein YkwD